MWWETNYTYIWVFNTGRGLSIAIRLPHNIGILYDLGCSNDFQPSDFVKEQIVPHLSNYQNTSKKIAQCVISHPHVDHIQEIEAILSNPLDPALLTCPNDHPDEEHKVDLSRIENDGNEELLEKYRAAYEHRNPPLQTLAAPENGFCAHNLEYAIYYLAPERVNDLYPTNDHLYGNGLSVVMYLRHGNQTILIPGDVTPEVLSEILDDTGNVQKRYTYFAQVPPEAKDDFNKATSSQPSLKSLLSERGLSILVAPHHGLESCFSPYLFENIKENKTKLNVISEKRHVGENDGTVSANYSSSDYSSSLNVDVEGKTEKRKSISTRNGHHFLMIFKGTNALPEVYLRTDPFDLLKIT